MESFHVSYSLFHSYFSPYSLRSPSTHDNGGGVSYCRSIIADVLVLLVGLLLILSGNVETNPGPNPPKVSELQEELHDLVEWDTFAIHLPMIDQYDIEKISIGYKRTESQKLALFTLWLDRCKDASWDHVVKALEKIKKNTLAEKIQRNKISCGASGTSCSEDPNGCQKQVSLFGNEVVAVKDMKMLTEAAERKIAIIAKLRELQQHFLDLIMNLPENLVTRVDSPLTLKKLNWHLNCKISPNARASMTIDQISVQEQLGKSKTIFDVLTCLLDNGLIGYLNFDLLKTCSEFVSELKPHVVEYEVMFNTFFNTTFPNMDLQAFISVLKENPEFKPMSDVGLPKFQIIIQTGTDLVISVSLKDLLLKNDDLTWAKDILTVNVLTGSIIIEFAVFPISATAVLRDLTNKKLLLVLREKLCVRVDVKLSNELLYIGKKDIDLIALSRLKKRFKELIGNINEISPDSLGLQQGSLTNDCFLRYLRLGGSDNETLIDSHLENHVKIVETADTPMKMLNYLVDSNFIHYLNTSLVNQVFIDQDSPVQQLVDGYRRDLHQFLHENDFDLLNEIFFSHPEYKTMVDTAGWPKLFITLEEPFTSVSIHIWNQILQEQFKWSSLIFLVNAKSVIKGKSQKHCVILEYLVLPIDVVNFEFFMNNHVLSYIGVSEVDCTDLIRKLNLDEVADYQVLPIPRYSDYNNNPLNISEMQRDMVCGLLPTQDYLPQCIMEAEYEANVHANLINSDITTLEEQYWQFESSTEPNTHYQDIHLCSIN